VHHRQDHAPGRFGQRRDEPLVVGPAGRLGEPRAGDRHGQQAIALDESLSQPVQLTDELPAGRQHVGQRLAHRRSGLPDDRAVPQGLEIRRPPVLARVGGGRARDHGLRDEGGAGSTGGGADRAVQRRAAEEIA
jgi:hypothetical protein